MQLPPQALITPALQGLMHTAPLAAWLTQAVCATGHSAWQRATRQAHFSSQSETTPPRYAPPCPAIRVAGGMAQEIFPVWRGADAALEANRVIRFFCSMPKATGHTHRHWAFFPDAHHPGQAFIQLAPDGQPILMHDAQVFRVRHNLLPLAPELAARFYLHHNPFKPLHGFFDDRTLVADLYLRLLDPRENTWLREHRRFVHWIRTPCHAPLILHLKLDRPIGCVMQRQGTGVSLLEGAATDCIAVLKKIHTPGQSADFYLATAYPIAKPPQPINH